jgi:hypothetical protein
MKERDVLLDLLYIMIIYPITQKWLKPRGTKDDPFVIWQTVDFRESIHTLPFVMRL